MLALAGLEFSIGFLLIIVLRNLNKSLNFDDFYKSNENLKYKNFKKSNFKKVI